MKFVLWIIPLLISSFDLTLIGVFSENTGSIHGVVSEIFFALMVITMLTFSYVSWPLGLSNIGAVALIFGILSSLIWFVKWPWIGVAIQGDNLWNDSNMAASGRPKVEMNLLYR